jgi:hypothetical protein
VSGLIYELNNRTRGGRLVPRRKWILRRGGQECCKADGNKQSAIIVHPKRFHDFLFLFSYCSRVMMHQLNVLFSGDLRPRHYARPVSQGQNSARSNHDESQTKCKK